MKKTTLSILCLVLLVATLSSGCVNLSSGVGPVGTKVYCTFQDGYVGKCYDVELWVGIQKRYSFFAWSEYEELSFFVTDSFSPGETIRIVAYPLDSMDCWLKLPPFFGFFQVTEGDGEGMEVEMLLGS